MSGVTTTSIGNESNTVQAIELLNNGKIIVLAKTENNGVVDYHLLRYLFDGTLDSSYGNNGIVDLNLEPNFSSSHIANYSDGKIAVIASKYNFENETREVNIFRYLLDGNFDSSFAENGYIVFNNSGFLPKKIIVQQNQRLLLYGEFSDPLEGGGPNVLIRYHINGSIDNSFSFFSISYEVFSSTMIIQDDGKILCVASSAWYNGPEDFVLERCNNTPLSVTDFYLNDVSIYPNPSSDIFTIDYEMIHSELNYQVTDVLGKEILTGQLDTLQTNINLSEAQSGMYFLNIQDSTYRLLKD